MNENHKETGSGCIYILCNIEKNKRERREEKKGRQMVEEKRVADNRETHKFKTRKMSS